MRFASRALLLIAAAAALSSCSELVGTCTWVVPEAGPELKVVEARKPIGSECNCINCGAPGRFLLERENYTLEFWNGDRWYGEILVRARNKDGASLTLSSDLPEEFLRMAPHVPESATRGFEYFMRVEPQEGKYYAKSLRISVTHPDGHVLGVETIRLRVESRKDMSLELEL